MCDNWQKNYAEQIKCEGMIINDGEGEYKVKGRLTSGKNVKIYFWAANPPTYNSSYSGSGLPYPNPNIAFDNSTNRGIVKTIDGNFEFNIKYPNSYYLKLGSFYVEPSCYIKICGTDEIHTIKLGSGIPFRLLTYPPPPNTAPRKCPLFYKKPDIITTQENLLKLRSYPSKNEMPKNFWYN